MCLVFNVKHKSFGISILNIDSNSDYEDTKVCNGVVYKSLKYMMDDENSSRIIKYIEGTTRHGILRIDSFWNCDSSIDKLLSFIDHSFSNEFAELNKTSKIEVNSKLITKRASEFLSRTVKVANAVTDKDMLKDITNRNIDTVVSVIPLDGTHMSAILESEGFIMHPIALNRKAHILYVKYLR